MGVCVTVQTLAGHKARSGAHLSGEARARGAYPMHTKPGLRQSTQHAAGNRETSVSGAVGTWNHHWDLVSRLHTQASGLPEGPSPTQ